MTDSEGEVDDAIVLNRRGMLSQDQRKALEHDHRDGLADDLREDRVESVPVDIVLADDPEPARLYVARARGQSTTLPMRKGFVLLPGEHTAYVLPRTRLVVGLEPTATRAAQLRLHRADMLRVQRVTDDDLRLSREQRVPDPKQRRSSSKRGAMMVVVVAFMVVIFGGAAIGGLASKKPDLAVWMGGIGVVMTSVLLLAYRYGGPRDLRIHEGELTKYELTSSKGHPLHAVVGGQELPVSDPVVFALLVPGLRYRAHVWRSIDPTFEPIVETDDAGPYRRASK